jgi:hypothetical protein
MTVPVLKVEIDFASGPSFSYPLILDSSAFGILDTNTLGNQAADVVDISDMVLKCSTRRGRNRILSNFEAGSATVTLNDPNSDFNPQNTTGPYYTKLQPLRKIRIYAQTEYLGDIVEVNIFSGYITSYDTNFDVGVYETSTVTLQCVDGFRLLNNVSTGELPMPGCPGGQLSGARVDAILDFAGFPTSMRITDPGQSTMQADPAGNATSVLAAIQQVEQSEFGAFFMGRSGKTIFYDRNTVSQLADTVPRIYTDVTTPGTFTYSNLDFAFDDQLILNDITVTRLNGVVPGQALDVNSIETFFAKSGLRSDLLVETDQETQDQANMLLVARKNADLRIDAMLLNLYSSTSELETLVNLSLDVYTLIVAKKTMPGGSNEILRELFVQGVQMDITPKSWTIKALTSEPIIQAFILDSSNQGILDNNTISY